MNPIILFGVYSRPKDFIECKELLIIKLKNWWENKV